MKQYLLYLSIIAGVSLIFTPLKAATRFIEERIPTIMETFRGLTKEEREQTTKKIEEEIREKYKQRGETIINCEEITKYGPGNPPKYEEITQRFTSNKGNKSTSTLTYHYSRWDRMKPLILSPEVLFFLGAGAIGLVLGLEFGSNQNNNR
jgi:hypothetical protein